MEQAVRFRFKGGREYVHGTDAFNAIVDYFEGRQLSDIRLFIHDFIRVPDCILWISGPGEALDAESRAEIECRLFADGRNWLVRIRPASSSIEPEQQKYDENEVVNLCKVDGEAIELRGTSPYTFIETIVAMTKHLHLRLFPDAEGKWVFVRLELDRYENYRKRLKLILRHNLNFRLTKSEIVADGERLGDIYFSLVKA